MREKEADSSRLKGLAPAGAGLSAPRAFFARYIVLPFLRGALTFDKALDIFEREGRKIVALSEPLSREMLFERVLVPPLFGLEENSRYYSTAMVLEHLLQVGTALQNRLPALSRGEVPEGEVKIEAFKPYVRINEDIVARYSAFVEGFRENLAPNIVDMKSPATYPHPWFGPLDLKGWMVMGMIHQIVHRRQIEAVLKKL